jgi:hypothetical protein
MDTWRSARSSSAIFRADAKNRPLPNGVLDLELIKRGSKYSRRKSPVELGRKKKPAQTAFFAGALPGPRCLESNSIGLGET